MAGYAQRTGKYRWALRLLLLLRCGQFFVDMVCGRDSMILPLRGRVVGKVI